MVARDITIFFDKSITRFFKLSCLISYMTLFVIVFYVVVVRYLQLSSIFWIDDVINLLMVWIVFPGAVLCFQNKDHVRVTFFTDAIGRRNLALQKFFILINYALILFFLLFLVKGIWKLMSIASQSVLPRIPIAKSWWFLPILISAILMVVYTISQILFVIRQKRP